MEGSIVEHFLKAALAFASVIVIFLHLRRRIIGLEGVVIEGPGLDALIVVNGQKWCAVAADGSHLQPGDLVVVSRVQGLQLAVVSRKSSINAPEQAT
jgi:membrane-bound ClpP family serine protease